MLYFILVVLLSGIREKLLFFPPIIWCTMIHHVLSITWPPQWRCPAFPATKEGKKVTLVIHPLHLSLQLLWGVQPFSPCSISLKSKGHRQS